MAGLTRQQGLEAMLAGANGFSGKPAAEEEGASAQRLATLKALLAGGTTQANLAAAQQYIDENAAKGRKVSASIGADGNVALSQNEPNVAIQLQKMQMQNSRNENSAYTNAANHYQQGVAQGATSLSALRTGLGALQSNDASSPGQLNAAYLLANGFKRYNPQEASALNPQGIQTNVAEFLAKAGLDPQGKTLSDTARANFTRFANGKLDDLQDAHNTLKAQAQALYSNSQFADPNKAANLCNQLGAPVDASIAKLKSQFDQFHTQAIPQNAAQGNNAPGPHGLRGFFSSLWGGGDANKSPAPTATPPSAPVDPIAQELARRTKAQQNGPGTPSGPANQQQPPQATPGQ